MVDRPARQATSDSVIDLFFSTGSKPLTQVNKKDKIVIILPRAAGLASTQEALKAGVASTIQLFGNATLLDCSRGP